MGIIIGSIVAAVATGCVIAYVVSLTIKWLRDKIKEKLQKRDTKKVAVADINQLVSECSNKTSMSGLDKLVDEGVTHMIAEVGYDGKIVGDVEMIKDTNSIIDREVEELINRTGEGMVIVEG